MLQDSCDLDVKNVVGHTPLYVAAVEGYGRIVERIVGYGASVSALTIEGNTPLHAIINQKNMRPLSRSTPEMQKVVTHLFVFQYTLSFLLDFFAYRFMII